MTTTKESFSTLLHSFAPRHDLKVVFNDFLTIILCTVSREYETNEYCDQDLYQEIITRYSGDPGKAHFPELFELLTDEMDDCMEKGENPDILGTFYEAHCLKQQLPVKRFRAWEACRDVTRVIMHCAPKDGIITIFDRNCESGRLLLSSAHACANRPCECFGVSHHHTLVKITTINLLLSRIFQGEVMWADPNKRDSFFVSYRITENPHGVLRIKNKEHSVVWKMRQEW